MSNLKFATKIVETEITLKSVIISGILLQQLCTYTAFNENR